jgi:predicted ester cyclase
MSTTEENKAVVIRFNELENQGDMEGLFDLLAPGYVSHYNTGDSSLEQNKEFWPTIWKAFPDIKFTIEHMVAEGDMVAIRETWTGTHKGEFKGIAPTGRKVTMVNTGIIRIANGKFQECWFTLDEFGLMKQLGVIPG